MFCQKGKRNRLLYEDYLVHLQLKLFRDENRIRRKTGCAEFYGIGQLQPVCGAVIVSLCSGNEYWLYAPVHRENQQLSSMVAESRGTVSVHYPSYWLWRGMTSLWRVGGIRRTLKRDNIRLFHGLSNELPLTIHRVREVKSVVTVHDLIFLRLSHCFRWSTA